MRRTRLFLIGLAMLLLAGVGGLLLVQDRLDWTRYRATIEALASQTVGRTIVIDGPIELRLLPQPELNASGVSVAADPDDPSTFSVAALRLRVALGPLLRGRVDARELVLQQPRFTVPWPPRPGMIAARPPPWLAAFSARIENGTLQVGTQVFSGVDAQLSSTDGGGLIASGAATHAGQTWRFSARLTGQGDDGAIGIDLALDGQGPLANTGGTFSGQLAADGTLAGRVAARGPDLSHLLPAPALPFRAEGRMTAAAGLVEADDLALNLDGARATAAVALRVSPALRLDAALAANRIDLSAWVPMLTRQTVQPGAMPVGLDVSAEAATYAGGTLRRLRAYWEWTGPEVALREASAILPGDAEARIAGRIDQAEGGPRFAGNLDLNAPSLHATLAWLRDAGLAPAAEPPSGALETASLNGTLTLGGGAVAIGDLSGTIDGSRVQGRVAQGRDGLQADLQADRIMLDPFLPEDWPQPEALLGRLGAANFSVTLQARRAVWRGAVLDGLALDAAASKGKFDLRKLETATQGVSVSASGSIGADGALGDGLLDVGAAAGTPIAALLPPAWRGTPDLWRGPASLHATARGPLSALAFRFAADLGDARAEGEPTIDLKARRWSGSLTLRHPGARRLAAASGLIDPALAQDWLGEGSLSLVAQMAGAPGSLSASSFDLVAGSLRAGGQLALRDGGEGWEVTGSIAAEALPVPAELLRGAGPLRPGAFLGWLADVKLSAAQVLFGTDAPLRDLSCRVSLAGGTLRIEDAAVSLGEAKLGGTLMLNAAAAPPVLNVSASLGGAIAAETRDWPFGLPHARAVRGVLDAKASGYSAAALLATLNGTASLDAEDGLLTGFDLAGLRDAADAAPASPRAAEGRLGQALSSGATEFTMLHAAASIDHGRAALTDAHLSGPAGQMRVSGGIDLAAGVLDLRAALLPATAGAPEAVLRLTGPVDQPDRAMDLGGFARWLAARP